MPATYEVSGLLSFTIAILAYFLGAGLNENMPPPNR